MNIRFTALGLRFALLWGMFYLVAMRLQSGLLLLLLGILAACVLVNWMVARRTVQYVQVECPPVVRGTEGAGFRDPWTLKNTHRRRTSGAALVDGAMGCILRLRPLVPREDVCITPGLAAVKRGIFEQPELMLHSAAPFGLITARRHFRCMGSLIVHPGVYACNPPPAAGFEPAIGGAFRSGGQSLTGEDFRGVRPMVPGDPARIIHWASSAKGRGLMVRDYHEELAGRSAIIACLSCRQHDDAAEYLDWATRAVASLTFAALDGGTQVDICLLPGEKRLSATPFSDAHVLLDELAGVSAGLPPVSPDDLAGTIARLSARTGIAFVTVDSALVGVFAERIGNARLYRQTRIYLPVGAESDPVHEGIPISHFASWRIEDE